MNDERHHFCFLLNVSGFLSLPWGGGVAFQTLQTRSFLVNKLSVFEVLVAGFL